MDNSSQVSSQELELLCTYLWNLRNFSKSGILQEKTSTSDGIWVTSVTISIVICIAGLLGNALVIWITAFRMKKVKSNIWFLNLALADFGFLLFLPPWLASIFQDNWPFGNFLCKSHHFVLTVNMYASIFILTALSIDRALSVVLPLWHRKYVSRGHYLIICMALWGVTVLLSIPVMMQSKVTTGGGNQQCVLAFYGEDVFNANNLFLNSSQCRPDQETDVPSFTPVMPASWKMQDESTMASYSHLSTIETENYSEKDNVSLINISEALPPFDHEIRVYDFIIIPSILKSLVKHDSEMIFRGIPLDHQDCQSEAWKRSLQDCINASEVGKWQQMRSSIEPILIPRVVIGIFIPLIIIIASNLLIIVKVRQSQTGKTGRFTRLYVVILLMVAAYFLSWMPITVVEIMTIVALRQMDLYQMHSLIAIMPLVSCIASFNSCLNPILYVIIGRKVKKELKTSIFGVWRIVTNSSQSTVHREHSNQNTSGSVITSMS